MLKAFIVQERRVAQSPDGGTICSAIDASRLALVGRGPIIPTAVFSLNASVFFVFGEVRERLRDYRKCVRTFVHECADPWYQLSRALGTGHVIILLFFLPSGE